MGDAHGIIREANSLLRSDPERAAARYGEAVELAPGDELGYCGMALALRFAGRHRDSCECMEKLLKIRPGAAYAHGFMGAAAEDDGRKEEALACYERMLELDPLDVAAKFKRDVLMGTTGRVKDDRYYLKGLQGELDDETAEKTRRIIMSALLKTIGGEPSSNDCVVMTPGMRQVMDVLFEWSTKDGFLRYAYPNMYEGAPGPESAGELLERANELADAGRLEEAAEAAGAAIAADPDFADAHSARATFLARLGRYEEAVACVDEILRIKPDEIDDLGTKGMLLEKVGRPGQAAACYDRITEINPGDMAARYLKCGLLAASGDAEGLAECYRAALEAEPDGEKSADMQRGMRTEHREFRRRAKAAGSAAAGFSKFMRKTGVGMEPNWGRGYSGGAPEPGGAGRPERGGRVRAGRRR